MSLMRLSALSLLLSACLLAPVGAQAAPLFQPVWVDGTAHATGGDLERLGADENDPQDIVVWIHGLATSRVVGGKEYEILSKRLKEAFAAHGRSVAVVGLQWDSEVIRSPFTLIDQYEEKTKLARRVGRYGARQVLLKLQAKFPKARLSVFTHSLGSEVLLAALRPELEYSEWNEQERCDVCEPKSDIRLHTVVLAGSDLDYDVTRQSAAAPTPRELQLLWSTQSPTFRRNQRDIFLDLRSFIRGRAWGSTFPIMSEKEYDLLLGRRRAVFDSNNIPHYHALLSYYEPDRLAHIVSGLLYEAKLSEPPPELRAVNAVMDAPASKEALVPHLDDAELSGRVYALWRLEQLSGSGSKNFADGYLPHVADVLYRTPRKIPALRADSPSAAVRDGEYPTRLELQRAGFPEWADRAGSAWGRTYSAVVTEYEDEVIHLRTDRFGDQRVYDVPRTARITPSRAAIQAGSHVRVEAEKGRVKALYVVPFAEWFKGEPAYPPPR